MEQEKNTPVRILAREIAHEITAEEMEEVNGGLCRSMTKATYLNGKGDVEIAFECDGT